MILLANPTSRGGKGQKHWKYWQDELSSRNIEYKFIETNSGDEVYKLAYETQGIRVAVGGDGTFNNMINGFMKAKKENLHNDSNQAVGILYAGTSPDFCKFHSIPIDPKEALEILLRKRIKNIDLLEIEFENNDGVKSLKYFSCSSNIGLGAQVADFANKWRSVWGDFLGTGMGLIKSILYHQPFSSKLSIDGQSYLFQDTAHIIILKNPFIASGLKINLNIEPTDGKIFIVVITAKSKIEMMTLIKSFYTGEVFEKENIFIKQAKEVIIDTKPRQEVEYDGDPHGYTRAKFKILKEELPLIC